jgi:hypothetical protein
VDRDQEPTTNHPLKRSAVRLFVDTWTVIVSRPKTFGTALLVLYGLDAISRLVGRLPAGSVMPLVLQVALGVATVITLAATVRAASAVETGGQSTLLTSYRDVMRSGWWRYALALAVIYAIAMEAALALLFPALIIIVTLYAAPILTVSEQRSVRSAVERSLYLTEGHWWAIVARAIVFLALGTAMLWLPLFALFGKPDLHWIALPPIGGIVISPDPDPAWFPSASMILAPPSMLAWTAFWVLLVEDLRSSRGEGTRPCPGWLHVLAVGVGCALILAGIGSAGRHGISSVGRCRIRGD